MISELVLIPVIQFEHKESMNNLCEQIFVQLSNLQDKEQFTVRKMVAPAVEVPSFGGKYAKFYRYQKTKHVTYPQIVRRGRGDYFLNIDHSYGHLIRYLPGDRTASFCHDLIPLEVPGLLKSRLEKYLFKRCVQGLRQCKTIIAISEFTKSIILKHLQVPEERVAVVPLGVSEEFHPFNEEKITVCKKKLPGYKGEKLLLHIGHCAEYKNIECVLRILYELNRLRPGGYRLVKVGGPFRRDQLKMIDTLQLHKFITHQMGITSFSVVEYYNMCDFLIMPSIIEGQGLPILEAFKCKLPVICSDIPVFHEIGHGAATFLHPDRPEDWARYISQWDNPRKDHEILIDKGYGIAKDYTWARCAQQTFALFRKMGL